jgi:polyphosphate kinase
MSKKKTSKPDRKINPETGLPYFTMAQKGARRASRTSPREAQSMPDPASGKVAEPAIKAATEAGGEVVSLKPAPDITKDDGADQDRFDPRNPDLYLNRELTWLNFNMRVLHEAEDLRRPLLDRLRFLAIASANIDEFVMKRIGGLKQLIGAGVHENTIDGRTPDQQIIECAEAIRGFQATARKNFLDLRDLIARRDINIIPYAKLSDKQRTWVRRHYIKNIFPLVTPLAIDPAHPFPFISNMSLNLLVTLRDLKATNSVLARVKVPLGPDVPRFLKVDNGNGGEALNFVALEDVMANNLDLLFPDMEVEACELFRILRNANTEVEEEEAGDLMAMIETELRYRKFAPIVRLEAISGMNPVRRGMLSAELGLDEERDVSETDVMIGMRDLMEIADLDVPALLEPTHHPVDNGVLLDDRSIFHVIRDVGPILLQHPYESFATSVERFVREASCDPKVMAIKMTIYRTSADTRILDYLMDAARNGKQVAVAVELKARFDEAANIRWASRLEEVGIHVTYGVIGLKTHSKTILVVRRDYNGLRLYAHIGTGNYHAGTARVYSDLGLLTADEAIGKDLTGLFNYLTTGCKPSRRYEKLLVAPLGIKKALLKKIEREIAVHSNGGDGLIRLKTNALEDPDVTVALYRASQAGVTVELIIRDTCRLRPGVAGLSETISVISVIGRFLEHSRIYYFRNGGDEEYFIGSADLMTRNLEQRVEVLTPVEGENLCKDLKQIFDTQLKDRRNVWEMRADGSYVQRRPGKGAKGPSVRGCQMSLVDAAEKRTAIAGQLRKRKIRSVGWR